VNADGWLLWLIQPEPAAPRTALSPPAPMGGGWRARWTPFVRAHGRAVVSLTAVLLVLVVVCLIRAYGPASSGLVLGPVAAALLVVFSRRRGLTWADLGLSRRFVARGAAYAAVAMSVVAVEYGVAAMLPVSRMAFTDVRYEMPAPRALLTAFVVIPVGTVLVEELAFRGVLLGLATRHWGPRWGFGLSSVTFGAWHVLPSLGLNHVNAEVHAVAGSGTAGQVGSVLAAVVFTALAGLLLAELRRRSGSILAAAGLHWAVNALGVLVAAILFATAKS
jgi:membrane protease YdiL (CAAX protease family)